MPRGGQAVVGLDIGSETTAIVELRGGRGGIELASRPAVLPTPPDMMQNNVIVDPEGVGSAIKEWLRDQGIKAKKTVSSVGGQASLVVRITEVPKMSDAELKEAMQWDVERHIPFPATDIIVDYRPIERADADPEAPNMEVLLAVAQEDMINAHVEALQAAGLQPIAIDVQPLAASRALVNVAQHETAGQTIAIVNIGASTTDITVVRDLLLSFVRPVPIAGGSLTRAISQGFIVEEDEAERLKRQYADLGDGGAPVGGPPSAAPSEPEPTAVPEPEPVDLTGDRTTHLELDEPTAPVAPAAGAPGAQPQAAAPPADPNVEYTRNQVRESMQSALTELITELRRSIDFYRRQHRNENIDRIVLAGGGANTVGLDRFIQGETGITTEIANPYAHIAADPSIASQEYLRDVGPVTTVAAGLAMRDMLD
ncbi:MAG: type IV pilus assembly protein PilM [Armatimonadota bacterium]|jgi:type IV pilus assembly protein PilM